ncbi:hypothetical protein LG943_09370 [Streptomonospora sp. S1-112]|uniref:Uncharacterized protein n=1 Tax=Streptomonospora mangrovi TaxID=2883123 RepID=A0A9X3NK86_9ACTN|nr:hypothetical protein [Streptomonospora mangrovi]MDA0564535.1 hypothetical protein [Streptomonospora mangrovi]
MNRLTAALALAGLAALTLGPAPAHAEGFFDDTLEDTAEDVLENAHIEVDSIEILNRIALL